MTFSKTILWCDRILRASYYALILTLPIGTAFVEAFSGIIITAYFTKRCVLFAADPARIGQPFFRAILLFFLAFRPRPHPTNLALGIFLLCNFFSAVFSQIPSESWVAFVAKVFQAVMLYVAFCECFRERRHLEVFTISFLAAISLMVINGAVEFLTGRDFLHQHQISSDRRLASTFKHPNDFGTYLLVSVMWLLGVVTAWFEARKLSDLPKGFRFFSIRVWIIALLCATLMCLGLTYSRGAWLGFLAALVWVAAFRKQFFFFFAFVGVIFLLVFSPRLIAIRNVSFVSDDVNRDAQVTVTKVNTTTIETETVSPVTPVTPNHLDQMRVRVEGFSAMGRKDFWKEAAGIMRDYPLFGSGMDTYAQMAEKYQMAFHINVYPHNCYLQMGAETGILGLGSFLWLLLLLFQNALRDIKRITDPFVLAVSWGALGGLMGMLVHSFLDTVFYSVQVGNLMWIMMGVVAAIPYLDDMVPLETKPMKQNTQKQFLIFFLIVFVLMAGLRLAESSGLVPKYGLALVSVGKKYERQGKYDKALQYYYRALRHNPELADAYDALGMYFYREKDYDSAVKNLQIAVALNPSFHEAFCHLGMAWREAGQLEKAIAALSQALTLQHAYNPPEYYYERGVAFFKAGRRSQALVDAYETETWGNKELADKLLKMFDDEPQGIPAP